ARSCFEARGCDVTIVPVSGAAEIAPHLGVADMIVDITSTGSTLKVNGLREIETILESSARLIARPELLETERGGRAARELAAALESVLRAQGKRYLMANVPRPALDQVKRILPGLNGPTIIDILNGGDHVAAHAVVDASDVYRIIAELKQVGAEGILVTRIERLMPGAWICVTWVARRMWLGANLVAAPSWQWTVCSSRCHRRRSACSSSADPLRTRRSLPQSAASSRTCMRAAMPRSARWPSALTSSRSHRSSCRVRRGIALGALSIRTCARRSRRPPARSRPSIAHRCRATSSSRTFPVSDSG